MNDLHILIVDDHALVRELKLAAPETAAVALTALGVQGMSSALATFWTSWLIDVVVARGLRLGWSPAAALAAGVLGGTSVAAAQHLSVNLMAGTPALWATVALPMTAGLVYSAIYAGAAVRRERLGAHAAASAGSA